MTLKEHLATTKFGVKIWLDDIEQSVRENPTDELTFIKLIEFRSALWAATYQDEENLARAQKLIDICVKGELPDTDKAAEISIKEADDA